MWFFVTSNVENINEKQDKIGHPVSTMKEERNYRSYRHSKNHNETEYIFNFNGQISNNFPKLT